jgi:RNA polymerase sigma factor (sigma-70 family)
MEPERLDQTLMRQRAAALEEDARLATHGNRAALERLVRSIQGNIYGLALRMLCNREDAEDATQEILVRIITRLSQFDFRSRLTTWAYRIAVNYILDARKSAVERMHLSFERFADDLTGGLELQAPGETEHSLLIEEVKVACTLGMLQCLDRPHRMVYVLGEILEMTGPEASEILCIEPALFRKRLQHAREAILGFTRRYCGLASDSAPCTCNRQLPAALRAGKIRETACDFAAAPSSFQQARARVRQVEEARWALQVHRTTNPRPTSVDFARRLAAALDTHLDPGPES